MNGVKTSSNFFKTTDSASNWNNNNTGLVTNTGFVTEVDSLAVAPNAPNTIYAENEHGPYRSADGGATWTKTLRQVYPQFRCRRQLLPIQPTLPLFTSAWILGVYSNQPTVATTGAQLTCPLNNASVFTVVFDPSTPSTMYVGSSKGVFKSTDSGNTWLPINNFGTDNAPNVRTIASIRQRPRQSMPAHLAVVDLKARTVAATGLR